ncbi:UDP-glucosyltransferase family protein [Medicago truncatula]|uniref:Glycosyltransferase n=1 Tax=Medicago truncatula TaxID=3880 RepID=A0A072TMQ3_MEDTR|nr:UDP-glucosyltransferase family protein [Medicago truncatula]
MAKTTHIAVVSIPLFSHQSSIIEFCKRLIHLHHHIHVTCIFPTIDAPIPATLKLLESLPSSISCSFLPPINKLDFPHDVGMEIELAVVQSMPSLRNSLRLLCSTSTCTPVSALVVDPFASQALEIAKDLNLLSFVYFPLSAMITSLHFYCPTLHKQVSCEYKDHTDLIQIPGCLPILGKDLPPEFFHDRSSVAYSIFLLHSKNLSLAHGFLANSFSKMEASTGRALQEEHNKTTKLVYMVGPIIQSGSNCSEESNGSICLKWLENQTPNSVLYVCFGSGGTLSQQQTNELALGLELSGQKFLWVLREPSKSKDVDYKIASIGNDDYDLLKYLPHGFLDRTKEQGLVVPLWAPQTKILSHNSTGGFLTHCGWNSTLESIVSGVPMITWPLFGDQIMNAILIVEGLKVGLKIKFNENGIAEREEIAKVVRHLMLGEERSEIRQRIEELKDDAACALAEDGSSTRALCEFGTRVANFSL